MIGPQPFLSATCCPSASSAACQLSLTGTTTGEADCLSARHTIYCQERLASWMPDITPLAFCRFCSGEPLGNPPAPLRSVLCGAMPACLWQTHCSLQAELSPLPCLLLACTLSGDWTAEQAFLAAIKTWPSGVRPIVHWSESQEGRKPHAHSDYISGPMNLCGHAADVDVMIEAKCKERTLLRFRDETLPGQRSTLDHVPVEGAVPNLNAAPAVAADV